MKRLVLRLASGIPAAIGLAGALVAAGPVTLKVFGGERLGGIGITCEDTTIDCQGILPNRECEKVHSDTCRYVLGTPNGLTCKPNANQSNACAGGPQYACVPREYLCQ